jgi:hypothetical protein
MTGSADARARRIEFTNSPEGSRPIPLTLLAVQRELPGVSGAARAARWLFSASRLKRRVHDRTLDRLDLHLVLESHGTRCGIIASRLPSNDNLPGPFTLYSYKPSP